jgi:hypothetical protein
MMPYVRDSFWRGRSFASVIDMQTRAIDWCLTVAGTRPHRGLDGAQPRVVFDATEAAALLGLPPAPFELARWLAPKVAPDCHVNIDKVLYSVPWAHIGAQVDARVTDTVVQIFAAGELIKTWPRAERGRRTDDADYPPEKVAFFMRTPVWCRNRADALGVHVAELVAGLLADRALHHLRAAQGILRLADTYGPGRLDTACGRALAAGDPSCRTVKGILAVDADQQVQPPVPDTASSATPAHLHGPDTLFAHLHDDGSDDGSDGDNDGGSDGDNDGDNDGDGDNGGGAAVDERGAVGA